MSNVNRTIGCTTIGALAAAALLLSGCSSGSSSSPTSTSPPTSSGSLTQEEIAYCTAVTTWGTSPEAANLKTASASGDPAQIKAAMKAYTPQTKAMMDSVPADAPAQVKSGYQAIYTAISVAGETGTLTQAQADAQTAAKPIVLDYYEQVCN